MDAATIGLWVGGILSVITAVATVLAPAVVLIIRELRLNRSLTAASAEAGAAANAVADAKADQTHKIVNSGHTLLLRKIVSMYARMAQLSGDQADVAEYINAKKELDAAEKAEKTPIRDAAIVEAEAASETAASKVAEMVTKVKGAE